MLKALIGYALLFMALGLVLSFMITGAVRFFVILGMLVVGYILLCRC